MSTCMSCMLVTQFSVCVFCVQRKEKIGKKDFEGDIQPVTMLLSSSSRLSSVLWGRKALSTVAKRAERPTVMRVGDFVEVKRTYTEEEMKIFAELSGDFNPLHTDIDFAKSTRFGRPIVFGVLMNGWGSNRRER